MSMNETPSSDRVHIGFFGRRNVGKSSLVNAVTGQPIALVSEVKGTTTDPVRKAMEILPLGPVVIIDTPGLDDEGDLGDLRVSRAKRIMNQMDLAVLVADAAIGITNEDEDYIKLLQDKNIPYLVAFNKCDLLPNTPPATDDKTIYVSARTGLNISLLKETLAAMRPFENAGRLIGDLLRPSDTVILVTPIDGAAPKGRLILPQQQVVRDVLDADAIAIVVKEFQFADAMLLLKKKPDLVVTDSQVFAQVHAQTPPDVPLTSFSILMARSKGLLKNAVKGVKALEQLRDGDSVLICEGCTHHRQCDDIGTVKLPRWIREYTGVNPAFSFTSGMDFPQDLNGYKLVVHCGGCMLNVREMKYRQACAQDVNIPMTNYGVIIAYMNGILKRVLLEQM